MSVEVIGDSVAETGPLRPGQVSKQSGTVQIQVG